MKLIYRLFNQNPDSRESIIAVTSGVGIAVNLFIAAVKIVLGTFVSSIAIVSEGVNNGADAFSSVLTFVGTKLAGKHPDKKHPFGYRRIEYLTGLLIAVFILVTGIEMLTNSVRLIFHPEELSVSYLSIVIIAVSAVMKYYLGIYTIKMGKKSGSSALEGVGVESRNDSFASVITIVSSLVFVIFHISLDAYAGIIISVLIIKAGFDILRETLSELIGRAGEKELAEKLYREIRTTDGIIDAADMKLHNYGPDTWSGSVNIEIDCKKTVGDIYQFIHELQLRIMHRYSVVLVFGIYAVDNENEENRAIKKTVSDFVKKNNHIISFHALYPDRKAGIIYCDIVVDYEIRDWESLKSEFNRHMKKLWPQYTVELTVETEYV